MSTAIVWFRKELRIHDNEALVKALQHHDKVIPFYCFEETEFGTTSFGFEKTGAFRAQFLIESIQNLKGNLEKVGSDLVVRKGNTAEQIARFSAELEVSKIYAFKDIHSEETAVQLQVEQLGIPLDYSFGSTLFHVNDLPHTYDETPQVFTQFRKGVENKSVVRGVFETPEKLPNVEPLIDLGTIPKLEDLGLSAKQIDDRAAIAAKGGEDEALKRLQHYFFETEELSFYKEKRNGLIGANYSSKLSLWLWNGCISPRQIYWKVKQYEREVNSNQSTYWLIFELIWRDYFKFISLKHGNRIFFQTGIKNQVYKWSRDRGKFDQWAEGRTGVPFVDANMRELNLTGFMSNRGRQNVASFLTNELGIDWRMGAEYFESKLIDYDVASNYGNWMYNSGVGNDPRDRYFNIILQAKRYDEKGKYVKIWLPELKEVDVKIIHHPWTKLEGLFGHPELDYPEPMVEPEYWKRHY
jgi:deoxyribodipyrimidine photo-lyase